MYLFQHILCCLTFFIHISTFICCFSTFSAVSTHFIQLSAIFLLFQHILCCFIKQFVSVSAHSLLFNILYSNQHIYLLLQHILCCFNTFQTIVSNFSAVSAHSSVIKTLLYIHSFLFQHIICCIYISLTPFSAHFSAVSAHLLLL